jgi:hypothetical protein
MRQAKKIFPNKRMLAQKMSLKMIRLKGEKSFLVANLKEDHFMKGEIILKKALDIVL